MKPLLSIDQASQLEHLATTAKGAYIFHGQAGLGKFTSAIWLAKRLNCLGDEPQACRNCLSITASNFPDLLILKPEDKSIGIAQIHELHTALSLSPYQPSGRRIVIIDNADTMTIEAQNSLLKTLEEPPASTVIILVARETDNLLTTVISRCSKVFFSPLAATVIAQHLSDETGIPTMQAQAIANLADGSVGLAVTLLENPDHLKAHQQSAAAADRALSSGRFERLMIAGQLAETPASIDNFIRALTNTARRAMRTQPELASMTNSTSRLEALERFHKYRRANVGLKAALESLMLEL